MSEFSSIVHSILESLPNRAVLSVMGFLLLMFIFQFMFPALRLWWQLAHAIKQLKNIKVGANGGAVVDLEQISALVMKTKRLSHLWGEYKETLHEQKKTNDLGQEIVAQYRATAMAEAFFTEQVLVDTPLRSEFYKHLPGILTGLGIIGTFSGLIQGLTQFEVSNNPEAVRASLRGLIQGVGHAFYISATAIALAMLFTWIEKSLITARYRQVEDLCQLIDSLFDAGAGEEYLARLVQASETSATQSLQLKDAFVTDLKQILSEISAQQVQAAAQHSRALSTDLAQAFAETMRAPMEQMSSAVDRVTSHQGEAVNKLLTDVLASFSAQMQDIFGGQLRGMADLLGQTTTIMQSTIARFDQLAVNLQHAGQGAAETMAERLREAIVGMESRQAAMTQQMNEFVAQMRHISQASQTEAAQRMQTIMGELGDKVALLVAQLEAQSKASAGSHESQLTSLTEQMADFLNGMRDTFRESQDQTSQKLQNSLGQLGEQVGNMVARMDEQARTAAGVHNESLQQVAAKMEAFLAQTQEVTNETTRNTTQANQQAVATLGNQVQEAVASLQEMAKRSEESSASRQAELAEQSAKLLGNLSLQIDSLGRRVSDAAEVTKSSAVAVAAASKTAIDRMNSGADSLLLASSELTDAEKKVAATMGAMGQAAQGLQLAASTLSNVTTGVQRIFNDYKESTDAFGSIVTDLKATVETARKEASLSTELVSGLQNAANKLVDAQSEAERYLFGVTEVLGEAHESFALNIEKTLRQGNSQFHKELSDSVGLLKGAIQDLGDTLDSVASRR